jgi:hypothetical protein
VALGKLAVGCRQEMDDATGEVYLEALCYQFPIDAFEEFVRDANASGRYEWFPKLSELRQDLVDTSATRVVAGALPADTRTQAERQRDAAETVRRLHEIVGTTAPEWPTSYNAEAGQREPIVAKATDERLAELKRQAEQITAGEQPA